MNQDVFVLLIIWLILLLTIVIKANAGKETMANPKQNNTYQPFIDGSPLLTL